MSGVSKSSTLAVGAAFLLAAACADGGDNAMQAVAGTQAGQGAAGFPSAGLGVAGDPFAGAGVGAAAVGGVVPPAAGGGGDGLVGESGAGAGAAGQGGNEPPVGGNDVAAGAGGAAGAAGAAGVPSTGGAGAAGTAGAAGMGGTAGAAGAAGAAPVMTCTGKPGASGDETRTWNNLAQYIVHFPSGMDPNVAVPLVFVDHGFTMSGALMQSLTGFDAVADREGFVVAYPNGDGGAFPWNVGVAACAPGGLISAGAADSIGYHEGMLASIEETQCINPAQVFVTGFSMGGYFAHHMGCQAGNTFARAVGPHSGGTYPGDCPGAPVPIFIMHGGSDTFIDHTLCGQGARDLWLPRNGCDSQFDTRPVTGGSCEWYKGCDPNGQVVYCEFTGVGHAWASGATAAVWDFFKSYL